jgi:hypothetical protein
MGAIFFFASGSKSVRHTGSASLASFATSATAFVVCSVALSGILDKAARALPDTSTVLRVIATAKPPADYNPKTLITVACATVDSLGEHSRTEEQSCALTLSLPNGTLRATGNSKNVLTGSKKAFSEIETQVK